jgi:3-methyl-2-oxobutanoate hydroxymethyltransferase
MSLLSSPHESAQNGPSGPMPPKITTQSIQEKKQRRERITCLTAYDYATARLVDEAGIDMVLVGDSLAMVVLGYENTLPVTVDEMLHHTRAVRRAVKSALVIADMPYASYQVSDEEAVRNAVRFVKDGGAAAVKIEGGAKRVTLIEKLLDAEIPVMGHIGLTPQSLHTMGGYKVQGKTLGAVERLMRDAKALDRAGVFSMVLEGIPREVAAMITEAVEAPTIGIGAGPECDGQVLVFHDVFNLTFTPRAKFVREYGDAGQLIRDGIARFKNEVESGSFPSDAESYHLPKDTRSSLESLLFRKK